MRPDLPLIAGQLCGGSTRFADAGGHPRDRPVTTQTEHRRVGLQRAVSGSFRALPNSESSARLAPAKDAGTGARELAVSAKSSRRRIGRKRQQCRTYLPLILLEMLNARPDTGWSKTVRLDAERRAMHCCAISTMTAPHRAGGLVHRRVLLRQNSLGHGTASSGGVEELCMRQVAMTMKRGRGLFGRAVRPITAVRRTQTPRS